MASGFLSLRAPALAGLVFALGACSTVTPVVNAPGSPTTYQDPGTRGPVSGVGIESQDIVGMTDRMMRDLLASPTLVGRLTPPRVIIDAEYFANESASRLNKNSITDRLRVSLNRASQGRMVFVGRQFSDMVARERDTKRGGAGARPEEHPHGHLHGPWMKAIFVERGTL